MRSRRRAKTPALSLKERLLREVRRAYVRKDLAWLEKTVGELHDQSITDGLTGLLNTRGFRAMLTAFANSVDHRRDSAGEEIPPDRTIDRRKFRVSLGYLDLDDLKGLNERIGHPNTDIVLARFAEILRAEFTHRSDFIARVGGDEFVVVLPGAPGEVLVRKLRNVADILLKESWNFPDLRTGKPAEVRISFTGSTRTIEAIDDLRATVDEIIRRADAEMLGKKAENKRRRAAQRSE